MMEYQFSNNPNSISFSIISLLMKLNISIPDGIIQKLIGTIYSILKVTRKISQRDFLSKRGGSEEPSNGKH